jgi:hypothetical protein
MVVAGRIVGLAVGKVAFCDPLLHRYPLTTDN